MNITLYAVTHPEDSRNLTIAGVKAVNGVKTLVLYDEDGNEYEMGIDNSSLDYIVVELS